MKQSKQKLKTYFETGDKPTEGQYSDLIDSYVDSKQGKGDSNRRFVINSEGEVVVASEQKIPEYSFSEVVNNTFSLLKDGVTIKEIDLANYIDDTNLSRLISGSVAANGIATFTRDDDSIFEVDFNNFLNTIEGKIPEYTFSEITGNKLALLKDGVAVKEIDLSIYLDDTNLSRLVSGNVDVNGVATFTRDDNTTFTIDFSDLISPQVQSNWNETDNSQPNYIENKPVNLSDFNNDTDFITKKDVPEIQAGTNITIDNTDPLKPVINSSKDLKISALNGLTLASNQLVLGGELVTTFTNIIIPDNKEILIGNNSNTDADKNITSIKISKNTLELNSKTYIPINSGGNINLNAGEGAFILLNSKNLRANQVEISDINNEKSLITKEYADAKYLGGDGTITNLSYTPGTDKGTIVSSNGTDAIIPAADKTNAGLMKADFYDQGFFFPRFLDGSGGGTYTYSGPKRGSYTRVGNMVTFNIEFGHVYTTGTPTGTLYIENLPFPLGVQPGIFNGIQSSSAVMVRDFLNTNITGINSVVGAVSNLSSGPVISFMINASTLASSVMLNNSFVVVSGSYITDVYTP